jgi:uncharacterized protein (TIGR00299 family) protein
VTPATPVRPVRPVSAGTGSERTAWFHCFAGIAGDMALGALLDAGAALNEVLRLLERLPMGGWALHSEEVMRGGVAATRAVVEGREDTVVRTHAHIVGLIEEARFPDRLRDRALATFNALAEVEGRLHRRPPGQVHFHEVGGIDAIVDVVGTCAALEVLDVSQVRTSAVAVGTGTVRSAHGTLPNPSPACVELLRGLPTYGRDTPVELTTPTGAALIATLSSGHGPLPRMSIESSGYGAGSADPSELPNCVQVVVGMATGAPLGAQPVYLLETNLDDVTGETLAHAVSTLLEAGCLDAWITPVVMKKGRPGHLLSALVDEARAGAMAGVMRAATGSLGVRGQSLVRWRSPRSIDEVTVGGRPVRVKASPWRVKAEHDDAARVAAELGVPLSEVTRQAEEAWRSAHPSLRGDGSDQDA